ncbi:LuxR family two component transcriptional regulator [Nitrospirillum amazonense]|uniref:LuxR family two component transcriptional regulator n=1 Tax=Nitrospirillum amazonense TaxID=28077 RepID=A0A560JQP8_9PROT|nr:response regulator [Nitrospirillum amazonense]TWB71854.1 LuxR family two component transcriptional regulator [Nitrospirillum amazonense]
MANAIPDDASQPEPLVIVIDDDDDLRGAIADLFLSVGLEVASYGAAAPFLATGIPNRPCCLVLDVRMPEESGLELQARLKSESRQPPIIFITAHADVPMSVRAMKQGAINFLPKPFRDQDLLDAVWEALRYERERWTRDQRLMELRRLASDLTPRELEILKAVDRGLLNKQIAHELGIAEITVKMHRSSAFRKLRATTASDFIRKVKMLELA